MADDLQDIPQENVDQIVLTYGRTLTLNKNYDPEISKTDMFHRGYMYINNEKIRIIAKRMRLADCDIEKISCDVNKLKLLPFLIQCIDLLVLSHELIIIFENFDAKTSKIRETLNESQTLDMIRNYIQGLAIMHDHNMVAINLTVDLFVTIKVNSIDQFKIFVDVTNQTRAVLLDYCSPEEINFYKQHKKMLSASKSRNVFSFAISLIMILTGDNLFDDGINSIQENICSPNFKPQFKKLAVLSKLKKHYNKFLFILIQSMIKYLPERRVPLSLACNSIFMWQNHTHKEFLESCSLLINGCDDTKIKFNLNSDVKTVFNNYQLSLHPVIKDELKKHNVYGTEPSEGPRCFRNLKAHCKGTGYENLRNFFVQQKISPMEYVLEKYSPHILATYKFMSSYYKYDTLRKYYCGCQCTWKDHFSGYKFNHKCHEWTDKATPLSWHSYLQESKTKA